MNIKEKWMTRFLYNLDIISKYLSGVNFQALSSFWVSSKEDFAISSSLRNCCTNKFTAGSKIEDFKAKWLLAWDVFNSWIWTCISNIYVNQEIPIKYISFYNKILDFLLLWIQTHQQAAFTPCRIRIAQNRLFRFIFCFT